MNKVVQRLREHGHVAYLVGGAVRDMVLDRECHDVDVTTSASVTEICELFPESQPYKHETVLVLFEGNRVEVTSFRGDEKDLLSDLMCRDFTMNSLAYHGKIIDVVNGVTDIKEGIIRCYKSADDRFVQDPLRILRGVRFVSTLGFRVEELTRESMSRNVSLLQGIAVERIFNELCLLLEGEFVDCAFKAFGDVLSFVLFEMSQCARKRQIDWSLLGDKLKRCANCLSCRLSVLCFEYDLDVECFLRWLKCDHKLMFDVIKIVKWLNRGYLVSKVDVKRCIHDLGSFELFEGLVECYWVTGLCNEVERAALLGFEDELILNREPIFLSQLAINGDDLVRLGVEQGEKIGKLLRLCLDVCWDNAMMNNKEMLLTFVKGVLAHE